MIVRSYVNLVWACQKNGDWKAANEYLEIATELFKASEHMTPTLRRIYLTVLAKSLRNERRLDEAEKCQTEVLQHSIAIYGEHSRPAMEDLFNLAAIKMKARKYDEACSMFKKGDRVIAENGVALTRCEGARCEGQARAERAARSRLLEF